MMDKTDEELIGSIRSEKPGQYSEIIKRYQNKLYRYVVKVTGRPDDGEDIVQETFIKAYINLFRFDTNRKFSSWIYRIAHNEAVNFRKKNGRFTTVESEMIAETLADTGGTVEELLITKEIQAGLNGCLKSIPFKYREPLVLFFLEEKSYEEISDILRLPAGTVGTLLHRGKKILKNICRKQNL